MDATRTRELLKRANIARFIGDDATANRCIEGALKCEDAASYGVPEAYEDDVRNALSVRNEALIKRRRRGMR
jgi:hypothetical protein